MLRLSKQNKKQVKIVLKGIFKVYFKILLNHLKPKKYRAYQKYVIVSAVYNVEKYLDDYFKSIIHQRLDFKNNILLILVDDGSKDKSASVIKQYQQKYPQNIIYLYKENGGQASARNLGLKYLEQNFLPFSPNWISFTDPDDFLDRDCFYQVDKFLNQNRNEDLVMVACNLIFYFEKFKIYKDNHPLNFKFKENQILINQYLDNFIQLSAPSAFFSLQKLLKQNTKFDEDLKPCFEDAKLINEFLLENLNSKSAFLKEAKYFYRKRESKNSSLDATWTHKGYFLATTKLGVLHLLQKSVSKNIQYVCLYHMIWQIKDLVNSPSKAYILNEKEQEQYKALLDEIFTYIDEELILNCNIVAGIWFFHKVGILNCFKNTYPPFQIAYIEDIDDKKEQILIRYFTPEVKDIESIRFDDIEVYADYRKIMKHSFLDRVFCYEKRLWVKVPQNARKLEVFIRGKKSKIEFEKKEFKNLALIHQRMEKLKTKRSKNANLWLLADMPLKADDNAEHLYRYIAKNYPKQNIVFALRKNSGDYNRLKEEGFKLIDPKSLSFAYYLYKADKIISSHIDRYLFGAFGKNTLLGKDFIFLQHGITKDDISSWLNKRKIDCLITSTKAEYESIAKDYNAYKFSPKEVVLTGFARHDSLLLNSKTPLKQILIMPTWREYIVGTYSKKLMKRRFNPKFYESDYFLKWNTFLKSQTLAKLCEQYNYKIIFNPHPQTRVYFKDFNFSPYTQMIKDENLNLQKLFKESALMITDYSSVAFEMAYLEKGVLYYQFDKEEFFANHSYQQGYFSYEENGFGAVVYTEEALLKELENLLRKDCELNEPYKSRIENTFEFKDGKCCERIYEAILELDKT